MANFNQCFFAGRLTKDVEKVEFSNGGSKVKGTLAVNHPFTTKDGEKKEETLFIDFDLFGPRGEILQKYANKGKELLVQGRLKTDSWEADGEKKYKTYLVAENFQFLGSASSSNSEDQEESPKETKTKPTFSKKKENVF